jgi:hypothetical protein
MLRALYTAAAVIHLFIGSAGYDLALPTRVIRIPSFAAIFALTAGVDNLKSGAHGPQRNTLTPFCIREAELGAVFALELVIKDLVLFAGLCHAGSAKWVWVHVAEGCALLLTINTLSNRGHSLVPLATGGWNHTVTADCLPLSIVNRMGKGGALYTIASVVQLLEGPTSHFGAGPAQFIRESTVRASLANALGVHDLR